MTDQRRLADALRAIAMNDRTTYDHHEKRPRDGRAPGEDGGTIWITPREIAIGALKAMGYDTAALYWPFKPTEPVSGTNGETK